MKFLKFLDARRFGLRTATRFLNFTPASHNGFRILKFTPEPPRNRFGILKFTLASARLADRAQNFISRNEFKILKFICAPLRALHRVLPRIDSAETGHGCGIAEKRRAVKLTYAGGYLNSMRRRIARFCSAAARHGYKAGRAENFSKFDLTGALLNFISLLLRKFKPALLKFMREVPRDRSEILNFTPEPLRNRFEILKFTLAPRKFKPASIPFLNFISNFTPPASVAKFENGVKFKGVTKFKRSAR